MTSVEFEYHVQFPTPRSASSGNGSALNDVNNLKNGHDSGSGQDLAPIWPIEVAQASSEQKDLVVILFGWAGSKDQYLSKYSDIYLKRGCIVVRYITPLKLLFTDIQELGTMTCQLVNVLKDLQLDTHPIFFHVFSNGGGITYSSFLREMQIEEVQLDIRCTIFDSAPAPRKISVLYGAIVNINGNSAFRHVIAAGVVFMFALIVFWFHLKAAFRFCIFGDDLAANCRDGTMRPAAGPDENWMARITHAKNQNFMFIYSEADDLISAEKVEVFANILANRGNRIKYLKFSDSPHVKHYMVHPKEYVDNVVAFIRAVMTLAPEATEPGPNSRQEKQLGNNSRI